MLLFQLFHSSFKHFFSQSDIDNGQMDVDDDNDNENVGTTQSMKQSDQILGKLSQPSRSLQCQIDYVLKQSCNQCCFSSSAMKDVGEVDGRVISEDKRDNGDYSNSCIEGVEFECHASMSVNENKRKIKERDIERDRDGGREESRYSPVKDNVGKRCNANDQCKAVHPVDINSIADRTTELISNPCNPGSGLDNTSVDYISKTGDTHSSLSSASSHAAHGHDLIPVVKVQVLNLISLLLRVDPSERITAAEALKMMEIIQCNYQAAITNVRGT